ncbi:MAG: EAL domain-containing protein [Betaproteobacteria bacterium]|nr:EAL domain-containing protein [Betaproteobacteria bacterium]
MSASTRVTLRQILNESVHTVSPDVRLGDALRGMSEKRISCVVVVDAGRPVGIFTERDSVGLMARGERLEDLPMRACMRAPLLVSRLGMDHHRAYQIMAAGNARHLVAVSEDGLLLGLITEGDLLASIGMEHMIQPKTVADAMTREVVTLREEDSLAVAARRMAERRLSCIVVTRAGQPAGILSERDVVRLFRESVDPEGVRLAEVMSQPLHTVWENELLAVAMRRMEDDGIRRLVVVDAKSALAGLLTRHDIVKTLQEHYVDMLQDTIDRLERDLHVTRDRLESVEHRLLRRSVMDQVSDAVLVIELDSGRVVEANAATLEFLDLDHDELLALHGHDFIEMFPHAAAWRAWTDQLAAGGMREEETRFRRKDGAWVPVAINLRLARGEGRAFVVAVARDIARRKQDEARIRLDREQQKALREVLEIGIGDGDLRERLGRCLDHLLAVSWLNLLPKAGIFDLPGDGGGLRLLAERNLPEALRVRCARVALGECLCGRAAQTGATQFAHCIDHRHDIRFPDMAEHGHYNLPLRSGAEVLGVLVLYLPPHHPHVAEEQEFLEAVADALASLLRRERAEAALAESRGRLGASEAQIRLLLDSTAEAIFGVDTADRCTFVNRACLDLLGYEHADELLGRPIHDLIHHHHADGTPYPASACRALPAQLDGNRVHIDNEVYWRKDGSPLPVEYWSHPIIRDGELVGAVVTFLDISERRRNEEKLRLAAQVIECTLEGVMITDVAGRILSVNKAFTTITGYTEAEAVGATPALLRSGRHDADFYRALWETLHATGSWQGEIWNRGKTGEVYPEWLSVNVVRDPLGRVTNYVGVFSDISQIKHSEAQLEYLAHHDSLTDLPNRALFQSRLGHAIHVARRHGQHLGLLFLDLDGFKHINDSLGHPAGDELLQAIARRMTEHLRAVDTLARLGGDEFVILLENLRDSREAAIVAQNVLDLFHQPFRLAAGQDVFIGASIGISLFPDDADDATRLVRNADAALYQAKAQGRNTYRYYTESLTHVANERLRLESSLRRALERNELVLHYQPQVSLRDGILIGAEALVRWQPPDGELIPPARFIPIAEEAGLIRPLGEWVLRTACAQFETWSRAGLRVPSLAVNLSSRQFEQRDLASCVTGILADTGFPAERLELEITESAIMAQGDQAIDILAQLKRLGVTLSIDDFGTGYSSLAYLRRFAVDKLKIDQSFIRDIPHNLDDQEIAATIIAMARNLKLHVLAEGVETEEQLAFLQLHGCDACQGYLFSPPVPAQEFERFLRAPTMAGMGTFPLA